jgi:prevent-host-death family protein
LKTATISRLKASLSEYLSRVRAGEELLVTDRGRPVAKIVPLERGDLEMPPHLSALERAGGVKIGSGRLPDGFLSGPRPGDPEGRALKALIEEREETR